MIDDLAERRKAMAVKPGDECILLFVIMRKDQWDDVKLPKGSCQKPFEIGEIETLIDVPTCKGWGALVSKTLNNLGKFVCPEKSNLILSPDA